MCNTFSYFVCVFSLSSFGLRVPYADDLLSPYCQTTNEFNWNRVSMCLWFTTFTWAEPHWRNSNAESNNSYSRNELRSFLNLLFCRFPYGIRLNVLTQHQPRSKQKQKSSYSLIMCGFLLRFQNWWHVRLDQFFTGNHSIVHSIHKICSECLFSIHTK